MDHSGEAIEQLVDHVVNCVHAEAAIVAQRGQIDDDTISKALPGYKLVRTEYVAGKRLRIYEVEE